MARILIFLLSVVLLCHFPSLAQEDLNAPRSNMPKGLLKDSVYFSDSGYIKIMWTEDDDNPEAIYILEQADNKGFKSGEVIYKGHDRASFVSGLPNGFYYYRIRKMIGDKKSPWSDTITVEVKHHSLYMAFSLAGVGLLVFILTAGIIIKGTKANETE